MPSISQLLRISRQTFRGQRRQKNATASLPPEYKADPKLTRKLRYTYTNTSSSSSVALTITRFSLMSTYGVNVTLPAPTQQCVSAYGSVKLDRVQVWTNAAYNPAVTVVPNMLFTEFTWVSENSPNVEISSAGNQVNPGYITTTPPVGSLAGFWTSKANAGGPSTASDVLFFVQVPPACQIIVDLHITYVPCSKGEELLFTSVVTTTPGTFTYQPLDINQDLVPVGNTS